jgi:hypothetical protein
VERKKGGTYKYTKIQVDNKEQIKDMNAVYTSRLDGMNLQFN